MSNKNLTLEELNEYIKLLRLRNSLERKIAFRIKQSNTAMSRHYKHIMSPECGKKYFNCFTSLSIVKSKIEKEKPRIIFFIENIDIDEYMKNCLRLRYLEGLMWKDIAIRVGHYNEETLKKSCVRLIRRLERKNKNDNSNTR